MKKRKTKADRDQQRAQAEGRRWAEFVPKLQAVNTFVEAQLLVQSGPGESEPGRGFYSNLGFFLMTFIPPLGSNYKEKSLYLGLIQRIDASTPGLLKVGVREKVEEDLRKAMEVQGPY
jgi:hypothetical protein